MKTYPKTSIEYKDSSGRKRTTEVDACPFCGEPIEHESMGSIHANQDHNCNPEFVVSCPDPDENNRDDFLCEDKDGDLWVLFAGHYYEDWTHFPYPITEDEWNRRTQKRFNEYNTLATACRQAYSR